MYLVYGKKGGQQKREGYKRRNKTIYHSGRKESKSIDHILGPSSHLYQLGLTDRTMTKRLTSTLSTIIDDRLIRTGRLAWLLRLPVVDFIKATLHFSFHLYSPEDSHTSLIIPTYSLSGSRFVRFFLSMLSVFFVQLIPTVSPVLYHVALPH